MHTNISSDDISFKKKFTVFDSLRIKQLVVRYISALSILAITTLFTPNFSITSFPTLLLSAFVIILLDYMVATITGIHDSPSGRTIVGFVSCAIILYATQFIVAGYYISVFSSIIAALIYGTIDGFLPNKE